MRADAVLGGVHVGGDAGVVVIGALNVSPESFYGGSVHRDRDALVRAGAAMARAGAALLDVGARSTAPYLETAVDDAEEADRLARAVHLLVTKVGLPVSADTARVPAARAALDAGAVVVNDVTALADAGVARLVAERGVSAILMASPAAGPRGPSPAMAPPAADGGAAGDAEPIAIVTGILSGARERARAAGIPETRIVLDPGIGFFRDAGVPWDVWDTTVLARLDALAALGRPLCVGVSRKSFLGAITGHADPADRLPASLAATAAAVLGGAAVIRAHDVAETVDAVRVAERLRAARFHAAPAEGMGDPSRVPHVEW